jgi:hypothetical protein
VVRFHPFPFLEKEDFYRFDLCAECDPWLEYGNGPALRTHPAGPIGIAASFGSEEDESPPSTAIAEDSRAQARNSDASAAEGGNSSASLPKDAASPIGPANHVRSAGPFTDSSQGSCSARRSQR